MINSIVYLFNGIYEDPSGNWHELDRAVIVLVVTTAFALIRHLNLKHFIVKTIVVYITDNGTDLSICVFKRIDSRTSLDSL